MPTSRALALLSAFLLGACEYLPDVSRGTPAPDSIALTSGLVVSGAPGWCIDTDTVRETDSATVVIFGSCAALRNDAGQPRPSVPGIISVSVESTQSELPPVDAVEAFLLTDQGRAALSRDGSADSVDILETQIDDDTLFLHAVDRSPLTENSAGEYWRALFEIDGRVVTVSLVGAVSNASMGSAWRAALGEQVVRLKAANSA